MADGQAGHHRHAERGQPRRREVVHGLGGGAVGEVAQRDAAHAVEPARPHQLGEHPVDPVERLAGVLEHREPSFGREGVAGAGLGREQRKIATDEHPFGGPRHEREASRRGDRRPRRRLEEQRAQVVAGLLVAPPQTGDNRTVDRREPQTSGERLVQGRHVREAHEHLRPRRRKRVPVEQVDDPLRAVPASAAEHRLHVRVAPRPHQVVGARGVVGGQVGEALVRAPGRIGGDHVEAPRRQHLQPGGKPVGGHRP